MSNKTSSTYVEDLEDSVEILPPGRDCLLIRPRANEARGCTSLSQRDNLLLDLSHGPASGTSVSPPFQLTQYQFG